MASSLSPAGSLVMGPDGSGLPSSSFSEKLPPSFDGHTSYAVYRQDVDLWLCLTTLEERKRGPAMIGRLGGEAKASAKTLGIAVISAADGAQQILEHLDKSYAVDTTDQLDIDLAQFLDYTWTTSIHIDQFIAGFHSRLDKIASLNMDTKLKGHLLLRQAGLEPHDRNMIVGAASGNYDVNSISNSLRQAYRNTSQRPSSHKTDVEEGTSRRRHDKKSGQKKKDSYKWKRSQERNNSDTDSPGKSSGAYQIFYTSRHPQSYYTYSSSNTETLCRAIVDSGACASVVGKETLDRVMKNLNITDVDELQPKQQAHRFGNHEEEQPALFAVAFPFNCRTTGKKFANFKIHFDVIAGSLPFLIGFPTMRSMGASLNCKSLTLGMTLSDHYLKLPLVQDGFHVFLPFKPSTAGRTHYSRSPGTHSTKTGINDKLNIRQKYRADASGPQHPTYSPRPGTHSTKAGYNDKLNTGQKYRPDASGPHYPTYSPAHSGTYTVGTRDTAFACHENRNEMFDVQDLKKLHLQLKHGTHSAMKEWIKAIGNWQPELEDAISALLLECRCKLAKHPSPHPVASTRVPDLQKQMEVAVDVIFLEGVPVLHVVDKCTGWSETATLRRRLMADQTAAFVRIQVLRHGNPKVIYGDREYMNTAFKAMCSDMSSKFVPVAANDHEANGAVESANRTLRNFFRRIRAENQKSSVVEILAEATYGKNICVGNKGASSFELMYGKKPRVLGNYDSETTRAVTIAEHNKAQANKRVHRMLRAKVRKQEHIKPGDYVYFWRDKMRWLGPARVVQISDHIVTLVHDERTKTSSLNRVMKTMPPIEDLSLDDEDSADDIEAMPILEPLPKSPPEQEIQAEITSAQDRRYENAIGNPYRHPIVTRDEQVMTRHQQRLRDMYGDPNQAEEGLSTREDPDEAQDQDTPQNTRGNSTESNYTCQDSTLQIATQPNATPFEMANTSNYTTYVTHCHTAPSKSEKDSAYTRERQNWVNKGAMEAISASTVPHDANIIGSHTNYRRKPDGSVKARIVPWGHLDNEKEFLRTDAPSMNMEIFRLVISIAVEMKWLLCEMDVTAAFLQAKGFDRDVFVRPPREENVSGILWRLTAAAYGLVDSGRLWYLTSDFALCEKFKLTKSGLENTLYFRHDKDKQLIFILVCQVDNYIYAGTTQCITDFEHFLQFEFDVGELERSHFKVYGCEVMQGSDHSITVNQKAKQEALNGTIASARGNTGKSGKDRASAEEMTSFKSVLGKMLFIGRMSQPIMLRIVSQMATKTGNLLFHHLRDLDALIKYAKQYTPILSFPQPNGSEKFYFDIYSDASMPGKKDNSARGGFIIYRRSGDIVHPIYWSSRKLRRVARSSSTAEILAAADAVDIALYLQALTSELMYHHPIEFSTDSRSMYNLSTSTKEPAERLNKVDLSAIRTAFEDGSIQKVHWCPGYHNVSDALTKDNRESAALLLKTLRTGTYPRHADSYNRLSPKGEVENA